MKSLRFLSLVAVLLLLTPVVLAADFGVRAGRYDELEEEFVGAEVLFDIGSININPNIEYALSDDVTAGSVNLDLTYDIGNFSRITPYIGAGVGAFYIENDFGDDTTDILGNLIGGVQFELDFLEPYVQVKYFRLLEDENDGADDLAFTVGLRF